MDVKEWFENGTGMSIRELRYLKTPPFPYNIFTDYKTFRGADLLNNIIEHNITIEHYNDKINEEKEMIIEGFLNKERTKGKFNNFTKDRDWLNDEKIYLTMYQITPFLEKVRK